MRLYVVAGKATDAVTYGFLPAAAALGLDVTVLTDRPGEHAHDPPVRVTGCDVTDHREVIAHLDGAGPTNAAVFTNSDHLQAATALAADYLGLPGKPWKAALRCKNKALMRRHLAALDPVFTADPEAGPLDSAPYPLVLKPREGVASEDVHLVADAGELAARVAEIRARRADPLVAEEYLPGPLHTLETLGDGAATHVLGSFRTAISPPPHFVEERMTWAPVPPEAREIRAQLAALGVGLGACHTEFVVHAGRARLIEVNYRIVGDHAEFALADVLGAPIFEHVLRVHLGEPLPPLPSPPGRHAVLDYVLPPREGTLTAAPGPVAAEADGVRLHYRPHLSPGSPVRITHTNRDYLGTLTVTAPTVEAAEHAVAAFHAAHTWTIA